MDNKGSPTQRVFILLIAINLFFIIVTAVWMYTQIPASVQRVPIHFNITGQPNGYVSRSLFSMLYTIIEGIIFVIICGKMIRNYLRKNEIDVRERGKLVMRMINLYFYTILVFVLFVYLLFYPVFKDVVPIEWVAIIVFLLVVAVRWFKNFGQNLLIP